MEEIPFWNLEGADLAVPVRFGGATSPTHRVILRFGRLGADGALYGNVLAEQGDDCLVVRDVIAWDPVTRGFRISDPAALGLLGETLDPTAAVCGGIARGSHAVVDLGLTLLTSMLLPRFFVIGSIGAILGAFFVYYLVLFLLAHWFLWFVFIPGCLIGVVCEAVRDERVSRLAAALLEAVQGELQTAS